MDIRKRKLKGVFVLIISLILCLCAASVLSTFTLKKDAVAVSSSAGTTNIGDILLKDYESKTKIFNGNQLDILYAQITGKANATYADVESAARNIKKSSDFRDSKNTQTGGKLITLTIEDIVWNAVYLSTNRTGEPILTLWQASSSVTAQWNYHTVNANANIPSNMYSTSMIRNINLNAGGSYYTSNAGGEDNKITVSQKPDHTYAIYTMPSVTGSLTSFIEKPINVEWQEKEISHKVNNYEYDFNNDAYGDVGSGGGDNAKWISGIVNYYDKTDFDAWANDYIWLPSLTETGWYEGTYIAKGIWDTSAAERGNADGINTWLRSGNGADYSKACTMVPDGSSSPSKLTTDSAFAVCPAFHLNLKKAEDSAARALPLPKDFNRTYTGGPLTAEGETWYTSLKSAIAAGDISETYYKGSTKLSSAPTDAGTYEVEYKIENAKYMWADQSVLPQKVNFVINPKTINYPSINGDAAKTYNGVNGVRFQLKDFNSTVMDIDWAGSYDGVSINKETQPYSVSATKKGKYELRATIKAEHANNYRFSSTSKIEVEVTPAELVVEKIVASGGNSSALSISEGTAQLSVDVYIDPNGVPLNGDNNVPIKIVIPYNGDDIEISAAMNVDSVGSALMKQNLINLDAFFEGNYTFDVKSEDENYVAKLKTPAMLNVLPAGQRTNILWSLYEGESIRNDCRVITELNETGNKLLEKNLAYSGKGFRFEVTLPENYHLDESYAPTNNGYKVEKISGSGSVMGQDAGTYRTTIKLVENGQEYSIEWTIDKAKFDLTNVKWQYDGKIPFSTNVSEMVAKIDERTLPQGLSVDRYTGVTTGTHAGDSDSASVAFKLDSGYENNYELPVLGGKGTNYIYNGSGDFVWEVNWTIEKLVIKLEWEAENYEGKYDRQKLKEDKNVVEYEYYLWDTANKTIVGGALSESEIEIEENVTKYYVTKAVIKSLYANDVEFDKTDVLSPPFSVGESATGVGVTLSSNTLTYNGNSQTVKLKIDGALSESDFEIVYYDKDGTTPLSGAPTNVGKYRVEIKLKESVSGYYLSGDNVVDGVAIIEYEIKQMEIKNDEWNTKHNPPSLSVSAKEIKGIKHEYTDMDGNPLNFSDLKAGNRYKVRAVITDKNNYVFADGSTETEWVEFEIKENEQIYDPDDPNNPYYPSEGGDGPNGSDDPNNNGDGGALDEILAKLKDLPLWQLIASGISIILIIAFLSKTASNESKRKKTKKVMEKKYNTFYASAFLGISVTNWTVIASVLMGVAVLSLVFMIISQVRRNKAEEELEDAKEEYERNKEELADRKKESDNQRRDEDLKMILMSMLGGNAGNMQSGQGQPQGFTYAPQGIGADEIRRIVSDTMTAMLPNVQQALPQQASANDELVQRLIEQNEKLVQKLSEQRPIEKVIEKEVAASVNDERILKVVAQSENNDETIKQLLRNQESIMNKLQELSDSKNTEKEIVEKIVEVPVEKVVEKVVEKPVEKIVEVPVEVEKIVEKEVVKEVPIEVEKVVEKIVEIPAAKPEPKTKTVAPRLTLDEAYEKLSAKQKKFFDTIKEYALSKDKCKEKKSTYFTILGQSSVNPLVKLTIKKDCTVAMFKMEDEYFKDIRKNATSDGTKVKVKETELIVGDSQALATAKEMIDLREDQIERYNDYLKEQRSMKKR